VTRQLARLAGAVAGILACALVGCVDDGDEAVPRETQVACGQPTVSSARSSASRRLTWTVDLGPSLSIGDSSAASPAGFTTIAGAAMLDRERIVVLDRGSLQIRFFRTDGRFLRSVGRAGDGPGEFREMALLPLAGRFDTIAVLDSRARRLTMISRDGAVLSEIPLPPPALRARGIIEARHLVTFIAPLRLDQAGIVYSQFQAGVVDLSSDAPTELRVWSDSIPRIRLRGLRPNVLEGGAWIPFRVDPQYAVGRQSFYVTPGRTSDILEYAASGCLVKRIAIDGPLRAYSTRVYDSLVEWGVGRVHDEAAARRLYAQIPRPSGLPEWQSLKVDDFGLLWAEQYRLHDPTSLPAWTVFDSAGRALGSVEVPQGLRILQIGEDFILGVGTDASGMEQLRVHRLRRAERR
jgi:hypothetical protein